MAFDWLGTLDFPSVGLRRLSEDHVVLIFATSRAITDHKVADEFGYQTFLREQTPSERGTPTKRPSYRVPALGFNTTHGYFTDTPSFFGGRDIGIGGK